MNEIIEKYILQYSKFKHYLRTAYKFDLDSAWIGFLIGILLMMIN